MSDYGGRQQPGSGVPAQPYPATQQLPEQPAPQVGYPGGGYPGGPPPERASTAQIVLFTMLGLAALAALVFFLLVVVGVFDDDPAGVGTVNDPSTPVLTADGRVQALAQTEFSCPAGSMGAPTIQDPTCSVTSTSETVPATATEETTYRCPTGASGSPSAASPRCAATVSGTVAALTVTTLVCPDGSTGNPTPAAPVCAAEDQRRQVPAEASTTYTCGVDTQRDNSVNPPVCVLFVGEVQDMPAVEEVVFSCPGGLQVNDTDPSFCDRLTAADCGPATFASGRFVCFAEVAPVVVDVGTICPEGVSPHPTLPEDNSARWCFPIDHPCVAGVSQPTDDGSACREPKAEAASAVAGYECPAEITAADATVVLDRCQFSGRREIREPAEGTTVYKCPQGSTGQGGTPDAVCTITEDGFVQALAATRYQCPAGSLGAPTASAPVCTSTSTDTVPAITELTTAYTCPTGTTGTPTASSPSCSRATDAAKVPAFTTTVFSCPAGTSGTPVVTDPFCEPG